MAIAISLFNGFNMGIERTKNKPVWGLNSDGEWDILTFTGFIIQTASVRFSFGSFYELIELEDLEENKAYLALLGLCRLFSLLSYIKRSVCTLWR